MDCGGVMITALREGNAMIGLCTDHWDPDIWFPEVSSKEMENLLGHIRPDPEYRIQVSLEAIVICNECPSRVPCLEAGMKEENINHGIWGGLMVAERRQKAGLKATTNSNISDVKVSRIVRNKLLKMYEKNNS